MQNFILKIKLIYYRYLSISLGFILGYSLLMWFLVYKFSLLDLNEDLIKFWLPFCLPILPIYIWLRPRIKLLKLKNKKGDLPFLFYCIASLSISAPTVILQEYLITASGELTTLNSINDITQRPITKYYSLNQHYIDKQHPAIYRRTEVSGKNNEQLTFHLYVACPILNSVVSVDTSIQTILKTPKVWLGIEYTKGMSNNSSDIEKEKAYKELGIEAHNKFNASNLNQFIYLDHIGNNNRHKGYRSAIKSLGEFGGKEPIILEAKNEPFESRNGQKFGWIFKSFGIGAAIWMFMLVFPKLDQKEIGKLSENEGQSEWNKFSTGLSKVKFSKSSNLYMTVIIIGLNVLVFIVMVFAGLGFISFDGKDLYNWGADYRPAVIEGQWWRLLTSTFLHSGLMHLLMNMYGLFFISILIEPVIGRYKYIIAYLICGIMASIASIWWHPATISIGASGAIFGLFGLCISLITTKKIDFIPIKGLFIYNSINFGLALLIGLSGGIDNSAHVGGLLTGFILGYIYYFFIDEPKPKRQYKRKVKVSEIQPDHN